MNGFFKSANQHIDQNQQVVALYLVLRESVLQLRVQKGAHFLKHKRRARHPNHSVQIQFSVFLQQFGEIVQLGRDVVDGNLEVVFRNQPDVELGVGKTFAEAYAKAQMGAGEKFATSGNVFISVREADKPGVAEVARRVIALGYSIVATQGTAQVIAAAGLPVTRVNKVAEGRPHIVDMLKNEEIQLVFNTTEGRKAIADSSMIRRTALRHRVYCTTTIAGALAACEALAYGNNMSVYTLQDLHAQLESN